MSRNEESVSTHIDTDTDSALITNESTEPKNLKRNRTLPTPDVHLHCPDTPKRDSLSLNCVCHPTASDLAPAIADFISDGERKGYDDELE